MEIVHEQNKEHESSSQSSKKKRRGPTTGKKYKTHEPKFIKWSDNGKPIRKWANCYKTYIGNTVRSRIDININNWDGISVGLKDTIWDDVKTEFQIDDKMKDIVLRTIRERWKDFKTRSISGWISKKRKLPTDRGEPYEYYDGITQTQWETFKKNPETEEFKNDLRQKAITGEWTSNRHDDVLSRALEKKNIQADLEELVGRSISKTFLERERK